MYYADTYALIEILRGNPRYRRYTQIITGEPNMMELAYVLVRDYGKEEALRILRRIRGSIPVVIPTDEDYTRAAEKRLEWKDRNVSLIDTLGYVLAREMGLKFLTGDREFKGVEDVEWVK